LDWIATPSSSFKFANDFRTTFSYSIRPSGVWGNLARNSLPCSSSLVAWWSVVRKGKGRGGSNV
jgi:hypothetical protein